MQSIRNFVELSSNVGTSGQPTEEQFKLIAESGYETVINLAMPDHPDSIPHEGSIVTDLGMSYFHIPVPFDAPNSSHIRLFCQLMEVLADQKVWVHCIFSISLGKLAANTSRGATSNFCRRGYPDFQECWSALLVE